MVLLVSVISNGLKYLQLLSQIINNSEIVHEPKAVGDLIIIHRRKNRVLGWTIQDKEIKFYNGDYLDCDEIARHSGDYGKFIINRFSYHFSSTGDLLDFRIDMDGGDLHAHPDERTKLDSHLRPGQGLQLDINNFNLLLAIHLAMLYVKEKYYPLFDENADYINRILDRVRRHLK